MPFDPRLRLVLITPDDRSADELLAKTEAALSGGVRALQLRQKHRSGRELFMLAERMRELTNRYGAWLGINGRADVARAVGAEGVHVGAAELPIGALRRLFDTNTTIGYSAHTGDPASLFDGADYVSFSPVFPTPGKGEPVGTDALKAFCHGAGVPVIALGGLDSSTIARAVAAGASGIAVIRAIFDAHSPEKTARALLAVLEETDGPKS